MRYSLRRVANLLEPDKQLKVLNDDIHYCPLCSICMLIIPPKAGKWCCYCGIMKSSVWLCTDKIHSKEIAFSNKTEFHMFSTILAPENGSQNILSAYSVHKKPFTNKVMQFAVSR